MEWESKKDWEFKRAMPGNFSRKSVAPSDESEKLGSLFERWLGVPPNTLWTEKHQEEESRQKTNQQKSLHLWWMTTEKKDKDKETKTTSIPSDTPQNKCNNMDVSLTVVVLIKITSTWGSLRICDSVNYGLKSSPSTFNETLPCLGKPTPLL